MQKESYNLSIFSEERNTILIENLFKKFQAAVILRSNSFLKKRSQL